MAKNRKSRRPGRGLRQDAPSAKKRLDPQRPRWLRWLLAAVAALLFLPHIYALPSPPEREFGLPRVHSGDEPHYLLMVNSLLRDGDLDLANNYRAVPLGGDDAGERFRGWPDFDRHVGWQVKGRLAVWKELYEFAPPTPDSPIRQIRLKNPAMAPLLSPQERSIHWPGLPLLVAGLLFPLRNTSLVEPAALCLSGLSVVLAMLAFVSLARSLGAQPRTVAVATVLTFLGTPIWHYGRAFFTEPHALACALGAYALIVGKRHALLPSLLLGLAAFLKITYVVLFIPPALVLLLRRDFKRLLIFIAPPVLAGLAAVVYSRITHGSLGQGQQIFRFGDLWHNLGRIFIAPKHGILPFAPVVLCALWGWPSLVRNHRWDALMVAGGFLSLFFLTVTYNAWSGGYCFGPRYLVPVLPFLMLGLVCRLNRTPVRPWHAIDLIVVGGISILINAMGALPYWSYWDKHPFTGWF